MNREFEKLPPNFNDKDWVSKKISHMVGVDQYMRSFLFESSVRTQASKNEIKEIEKILNEVDEKNTADLKKLIKIYKWFKISEFGEETDRKAWLLVQHADRDPDFQKSILATLESLLKSHETNLKNYAYLYDRVAASFFDPKKSRPQRYGTQGICKGTGKWEPTEVEEPSKLDERRKSVELPPMSEYRALVSPMCP